MPVNPQPVEPKEKPEPAPKSSTKRTIVKEDNIPDGTQGKKPKKTSTNSDQKNNKLLQACTKRKLPYQKVLAMQNNIMHGMQEDEALHSLASPANKDRLKKLEMAIEESSKTEFGKLFLSVDAAEAKREFQGKMEDFWFQLKTFEAAFSEAVEQLDKEQCRLLRMYRAGR